MDRKAELSEYEQTHQAQRIMFLEQATAAHENTKLIRTAQEENEKIASSNSNDRLHRSKIQTLIEEEQRVSLELKKKDINWHELCTELKKLEIENAKLEKQKFELEINKLQGDK